MTMSLCERCCYRKEVVSGKGSRFLLCQKSTTDHHFPKYPPQPVTECIAFEPTRFEKNATDDPT